MSLHVKFLKKTDDQLIYTFIEDGNEYKYIDDLIDENTVKTQKYIKEDGQYILYDNVTYDNLGNKDSQAIYEIDETSYDLTDYESPMNSRSYNFRWKYVSNADGSTEWVKLSIGSIATLLAAITGGGAGAVMAVATYLFDNKLEIVYYNQTLYTDTNAPS